MDMKTALGTAVVVTMPLMPKLINANNIGEG